MKKLSIIALLLLSLLAVLFGAAAVHGEPYVSLKGDFYFELPEGWAQVDHRVVDYHLRMNQAGRATLDYEAAFAPADQAPFYAGPYFIMTVDTVAGGYTEAQIDSVLGDMATKFGRKVRYFPVANLLADMKSNAPSYDRESKTITVINDIVEQEKLLKKHLLVMKFFDRGKATFYFYAPDSLFGRAQPIFNRVLESFHAGDAESMLPKENLRVADIDVSGEGDEPAAGTGGGSAPAIILALGVVLAAVIILVIVRRKKTDNERQ